VQKNDQMQRFILIIGYFTEGLSLLILSLFIIDMFSIGGHFEDPHFIASDFLLLAFIPVVYSIGAFLNFKNHLVKAIIVFISFLGYNISLYFIDNIGVLDVQHTYILIPSILFVAIYLIKKNEEVGSAEYNILYGEYQTLSQNYKIMEGMMEITPEMLKDDNLDNLLQIILKKAVDVIPKAQTGSILIRNKDQMVFRAVIGYDIDLLKQVNLQFEDMYQYKLGNLFEPTVIRDIKTFNEKNLDPKKARDLDVQDALIAKSVLTCAITFQNEVYGFINLDNVEDVDAFHDQDKIYIKHLAQQIEMALRNQMLVESIYKLSKYDLLTGAYTRQQHVNMLNEVDMSAKKNKTIYSICTIDINGLKAVNDKYGHEMGDSYLVHFSKTVGKFISKSDFLSRTGGDEFVIVCPGCDQVCVENKITELRKKVFQTPFTAEKQTIDITFGAGYATFPDDGTNLEELIRLSDQRMYINKKDQKIKR